MCMKGSSQEQTRFPEAAVTASSQSLKGERTLRASDDTMQCSGIFAGCILNIARP